MMSTKQTTDVSPEDQPESPPTTPPDPASLPTPLPPLALQRNWYLFITDKIVGPNIRLFDNLFSLGSAILGLITGLAVMYFVLIPTYQLQTWGWRLTFYLVIGSIVGMIVGILVGGTVLMVVGWFRKD
jgi:hypothetical protein